MNALLLLLTATPIALHVDLSEATRARLGPGVLPVLEQRLAEEGFELADEAFVVLRVTDADEALHLHATGPGGALERTVPLGTAWRDELVLELAQRLSMLAHEAETALERTRTDLAPPVAVIEPREPHASAGLALGGRVRPGAAVDPFVLLHGALTGAWGRVTPSAVVGLAWSPGDPLQVFEVPVAIGAALPWSLEAWELIPRVLAGVQVHTWRGDGPSGARVDALGRVEVSLARKVGPLQLGLELGVNVSTPRAHVSGTTVLWSTGPVTFTAALSLGR